MPWREKFAEDVGKLARETERLRRDVVRLYRRVKPFDDEPIFPDLPPDFDTPKKWTPDAIVACVDLARRSIKNCEYDLAAIRGRMDAIEQDSYLSAELKEAMEAESERNRRR